MRVSILTLTIALCVGIAFGILYSHSSFVVLLLIAIVVVQIPLLFIAWRKNIKREMVVFVTVSALVCSLGIIRGQMYVEPKLPDGLQDKVVSFSGMVIDTPQIKDTTQVFDIAVVKSTSTEKDLIFRVTAALYPRVIAGQTINVTGKVQGGDVILPIPPDAYKSFDYAQYLHTKNIVGTIAFPKIENDVVSIDTSFTYRLYSFRESLVEKIKSRVPSPENALASGVLFGTNELPKIVQDEVRTAGLSHIIVLSGFNVAVLVAFVMLLLRYTPFVFRIVVSLVLVSTFVVMVGGTSLQAGGASLVRATLMAYVALLALYLGREYQALYALFFSLCLYVLFIPQALLYDVSLHLSFLATLGLIVLSGPIEEHIKKMSLIRMPSWITTLVSTTLAVMCFTTPYLMYTFGSFSLYSILANIVAVPLVPVLMAATSLTVVFSFVPLLGTLFSFITYGLSSIILFIAHITSLLPYAKIPLQISFVAMCVSYIAVLLFTKYMSHKKVVANEDPSIISF